MKKLLNKLSTSGNLREDSTYSEEEHLDVHYRKPTALPADAKDTSEDIKPRRAFSLSKATSARFNTAMEADDMSKKKSSTGIKKEKQKDKLNESDDKMIRKSKSLKGSSSMKKSSDQVKSPMKSPSIKNIFSSSYELQKDGRDIMVSSDSESEDDAFVPHQHPDIRDDDKSNYNNNNNNSNNYEYTTPVRVPSAPGRMASSPSPSSFSPSPSVVTLNSRPTSPTSPLTLQVSSSLPSPGKHSPTSSSLNGQTSPVPFSTSPTARVPAFTQSPPAHAMVPTPHLVNPDAKSGNDAMFVNRVRSESISDDYGKGRLHADNEVDSDSDSDSESVDPVETDEIMHQKKNSGGLFSFGSNKMKLKA